MKYLFIFVSLSALFILSPIFSMDEDKKLIIPSKELVQLSRKTAMYNIDDINFYSIYKASDARNNDQSIVYFPTECCDYAPLAQAILPVIRNKDSVVKEQDVVEYETPMSLRVNKKMYWFQTFERTKKGHHRKGINVTVPFSSITNVCAVRGLKKNDGKKYRSEIYFGYDCRKPIRKDDTTIFAGKILYILYENRKDRKDIGSSFFNCMPVNIRCKEIFFLDSVTNKQTKRYFYQDVVSKKDIPSEYRMIKENEYEIIDEIAYAKIDGKIYVELNKDTYESMRKSQS